MALTRVCIYTRISTDEENQPTSLHSQRERLEAFSKAQEGWRIVAHKQDQATGTKLDRPGLQAALDLARSGAVDMLLVYRVDRLSRKVRQLAQLTEELDALGVALLRLLIDELRVNGRREIVPAYRLVTPEVCAMSEKVERTGIEPVTSGLQSRRSPS